jgi:hypothetical protein
MHQQKNIINSKSFHNLLNYFLENRSHKKNSLGKIEKCEQRRERKIDNYVSQFENKKIINKKKTF